MFKLLKDGECYTPQFIGKKDILMVCGKICKVEDNIVEAGLWDVETFNCRDKIICPGFIDQHVHITGGGGEQGPSSRIPELMASEITAAGVTTLVGVLGVDSVTRNIAGLLSKARALDIEGINTYIYTGSYGVPTATLTGKVISDIALIDKIIGVGEIAIADYRSSHPDLRMLMDLAYEARVGGLLGGKAGIMHIHVGDGKDGLSALFQLVENSNFPIEMFVPTHLNRNKKLFGQAIDYAGRGGYIDLTAGESSENGYSVPDALQILLEKEVEMGKVTVSSDGNGSIPSNDGKAVGKVAQLFDDIKSCIIDKNISIDLAIASVTSNVAKILRLYPEKGAIQVGSSADILVIDKENFIIDKMFINGELFINNGNAIRKGIYEKG